MVVPLDDPSEGSFCLAERGELEFVERLADLAPPISLDSRLAREPGSREKGVLDVSEAEGVRSDRRSWRAGAAGAV
ncbi:MAG TPA: hypothetical protein VLA09_09730, partial [Longimicrobiales bacterium]|nr:hypothetical protein [Longimicrobiales bacterium]